MSPFFLPFFFTEALAAAKIETEVSELSLIPKDTVDLDVSAAQKVLKLMERLDDHEVQQFD